MNAPAAALAAALLLLSLPAAAVLPGEQLPDPAQEARARELSKELRCVVCQNQSIDDSDAPLAADLRAIVRERIAAGDTNEQARDYIVRRYGSYVLLKPPVEAETLPLWLGPAAFVGFGIIGAAVMLSRRRRLPETAPLTPDELARLNALAPKDPPA